MSEEFNHQSITAGLQTWWSDQFPLSVQTIYPGMTIDTSTIDEWMDLKIDTWSRKPQRATGKRLINFSMTVHCFVKPAIETYRIQTLVDAARKTLSQQNIPVRDYDNSGSPVVGYARLIEIEVRDLSRNDLNSNKHNLHHVAISSSGIAQEL